MDPLLSTPNDQIVVVPKATASTLIDIGLAVALECTASTLLAVHESHTPTATPTTSKQPAAATHIPTIHSSLEHAAVAGRRAAVSAAGMSSTVDDQAGAVFVRTVMQAASRAACDGAQLTTLERDAVSALPELQGYSFGDAMARVTGINALQTTLNIAESELTHVMTQSATDAIARLAAKEARAMVRL